MESDEDDTFKLLTSEYCDIVEKLPTQLDHVNTLCEIGRVGRKIIKASNNLIHFCLQLLSQD